MWTENAALSIAESEDEVKQNGTAEASSGYDETSLQCIGRARVKVPHADYAHHHKNPIYTYAIRRIGTYAGLGIAQKATHHNE